MLRNDCTDKRLIDWENKAKSYDIVHTTEMMPEILESRIARYLQHGVDLSHLIGNEYLYVGYSTIDFDMAALLVTSEDRVILELGEGKHCCNYEIPKDYHGQMTRDGNGFWAYLDSFPNSNKYLISTV